MGTLKRPAAGWFFVLGAVCGASAAALWHAAPAPSSLAAEPSPPSAASQMAALAAEIETIKGKLPDQAHAMQDVGYHYTNLYFAGHEAHWDLASFYLSETKSHLRWAVRIIPKRKDNAGREIDLEAILQSLENSPLKELSDAIAAHDSDAFAAAYRTTLEACYACHKAADKPFLRPQMPETPATSIIQFAPHADWPK